MVHFLETSSNREYVAVHIRQRSTLGARKRSILCLRATVSLIRFFIQFSKYLPELQQVRQENVEIDFNSGSIKIIPGF